MLEPSMCLVIQGGKKILIGNDIIRYGAGSYLVSAIDMPTSGQVTTASRAVPYVGLRIDWRPEEISGLILDMQIAVPDKLPASVGAAVNTADTELQDALLRLVRLLDKPRDIPALAPLIKREILYRLLTASGGSTLYQSLLAHHQERGVNAAIQWIKKNFDQPMTIESLASAASMSASTLHRHFKAITTISPLQYQKQVRLLEARKLLFTGNVEAATAAFRVGYESPSQFSREYRRLFGATPVQDSKVNSSFAL
jgi:AraC-like DNA-binding protein